MSGLEVLLPPTVGSGLFKLLCKAILRVSSKLDEFHSKYDFRSEKMTLELLHGQCVQLENMAPILSHNDSCTVQRAIDYMHELFVDLTEKVQRRRGCMKRLIFRINWKALQKSVTKTLSAVSDIINHCRTTIAMSSGSVSAPNNEPAHSTTVYGSTSRPDESITTQWRPPNVGHQASYDSVVTGPGLKIDFDTRKYDLKRTSSFGICLTLQHKARKALNLRTSRDDDSDDYENSDDSDDSYDSSLESQLLLWRKGRRGKKPPKNPREGSPKGNPRRAPITSQSSPINNETNRPITQTADQWVCDECEVRLKGIWYRPNYDLCDTCFTDKLDSDHSWFAFEEIETTGTTLCDGCKSIISGVRYSPSYDICRPCAWLKPIHSELNCGYRLTDQSSAPGNIGTIFPKIRRVWPARASKSIILKSSELCSKP